MLNAGQSPIVEPGLAELIAPNVAAGRLRATTSAAEAIEASEVSLVSVSTPSRRNGSLDLTHLDPRVRAGWRGACGTTRRITSS